MKKNNIFYFSAFILLALNFLFFNRAYKEMTHYSGLTDQSVIVYNSFQTLSKQINNAAVINPDLIKANAASHHANLFFADSQSVIQQLDLLKASVRDSLNIRIADALDDKVRSELSWMLRSNVPDSILHHRSSGHLAAFASIDSLMNKGIRRTNFLFDYRSEKLNESISSVRSWTLGFFILAFLLIIIVSFNLFWQKSKRKETEKALEGKEIQFRNTLDNMIEGIQIHDRDWKYIYVNDTLAKYSKYSKEELLGYSLMEKYPGIEQSDLFATLRQCMDERVSRQFETEFIFPDGSKADFELSVQPVPEGIFILSIDITERKRSERRLEQSIRELTDYKFAIDESAIVAITDQKGIIKHVNPNFCKISKYSEADLLGQDHRLINSGFHSKEVIRNLWHTIANGKIWKGELKNKAKDGSYYWVDTTIVPFLNPDGKPYQYLAIRSDITERKRAEEKIIKANRLYSVLSAINQNIVHSVNQQEMLDNVCTISTELGQFKLAWLGMLDGEGILNMTNFSSDNINSEKIIIPRIDPNDPDLKDSSVVNVLKTGRYYINNDMQNDPALSAGKSEFINQGISASIALPITIMGKAVGIFALLASTKDFFDDEEVNLLKEAAGDISFALENFEKARKHRLTEDLVIKNESRFRSLIENSTDMKTLTSIEGKFMYGSPSISKIFGYSVEEFLGKTAFDFFHPDDIPDLMQNRANVLTTPGKSFSFQYRFIHKNGHYIWCEGTLTNLLEDPAVNALVSNFRDITENKSAEQRQEFDRNNLDALINNTMDLLWSVDRDFRLITFNQPFFNVIKHVTGKELAKGDDAFSVALSQEQWELFKGLYLRAFEGEAFTDIQYIEGPVETWIETSFFPIRNGDEVIGTACHSRDVTERRKAEAEREKMTADLIVHNKNLEQFTYVVSHNLRSPVANILGLSNVLKEDISDTDRKRSQQFLFTAVEQLDMTVKDLNKILQVRSAISESKELTDFEELLEGIKLSIQNSIQKEDVQIIADFKNVRGVSSVKSYIHSIFFNLITNSIKYRQPDRALVIQIRSDLQDGKITISFKDNGSGMDLAQYGNKVFGLYKRFHLNIEGKGLGLFMVKTQVESLGGSIKVNSSPGKGAEFIVELSSLG